MSECDDCSTPIRCAMTGCPGGYGTMISGETLRRTSLQMAQDNAAAYEASKGIPEDFVPPPLTPFGEAVLRGAFPKTPENDAVFRPAYYARYAIEPITFIVANNLPFTVGNVIKYVLRYDAKNGVEDLRKARRYLDILTEDVERRARGEAISVPAV